MSLIRMTVAAVFATALAGLVACGADRVQARPQSSLTLKVESSGGVAGLQREISLGSDGLFTIKDLRKKTEATIALTPGELQQIEQLSADLPEPTPAPLHCPDCTVHVITLTRDGNPRRILVPTPLGRDSPYQPLLRRVLDLAESAARQ